MKPLDRHDISDQKIDLKFVFYAATSSLVVAAAFIAVATIRSDADRREHEARKFEERWIAEAYNVAAANQKMSQFDERLYSLERKNTELTRELRQQELYSRLQPRIGEKITVTGRLENSKIGWYVDVDEFESHISMHPTRTSAGFYDARILEKYGGKSVRVTGILHFESRSDDASSIARFWEFFFDPLEAKIEVPDR